MVNVIFFLHLKNIVLITAKILPKNFERLMLTRFRLSSQPNEYHTVKNKSNYQKKKSRQAKEVLKYP